MAKLEIVGVHPAGIFSDGTLRIDTANRVIGGMELLKAGETEYVVMLSKHGHYLLRYALKKYNVSRRKILVEGHARGSTEEVKNFKYRIIDINGFTRIGVVSQQWHINPRLRMIYGKFLPPTKYGVEFFPVEDGRPEHAIRRELELERKKLMIDYYRLQLPLGSSIFAENISEMAERIYFRSSKGLQSSLDGYTRNF
jgi:uncharacterized SAM-binding protein YcdF (DUF218 family)